MLRKMTLLAPWDLIELQALEASARLLGYGVDDSGWIEKGKHLYEGEKTTGTEVPEDNRAGFVAVVFDDAEQTQAEVISSLRAVTEVEFTKDECIVCMPDGLDKEWYDMVWPLAMRLHQAEAKAHSPEGTASDLEAMQTFRDALQPILDQGHSEAEVNLSQWFAKINAALGIQEGE